MAAAVGIIVIITVLANSFMVAQVGSFHGPAEQGMSGMRGTDPLASEPCCTSVSGQP